MPRRARYSSAPESARRKVTGPGASLTPWRLESLPLLLGRERVGDLRQVAVQDLLEPVQRQLDAMVGDAALGVVVGADLLRPLARADLRSPGRGLFGLLAPALLLVEESTQDAHRLGLVLKL